MNTFKDDITVSILKQYINVRLMMDSNFHKTELEKFGDNQIIKFLDCFNPAWSTLKSDEQYILINFYSSSFKSENEAATYIAQVFHIDISSVYQKKDNALDHLSNLLLNSGR